MKLLLDENLSPRLVASITDLFPDSAHVHQCGLGSSADAAIWEYARENGFTVVSKDTDFEERSILLGSPPKIILLRMRNSSSAEVESLLRAAFPVISRFIEQGDETCLVLGRR